MHSALLIRKQKINPDYSSSEERAKFRRTIGRGRRPLSPTSSVSSFDVTPPLVTMRRDHPYRPPILSPSPPTTCTRYCGGGSDMDGVETDADPPFPMDLFVADLSELKEMTTGMNAGSTINGPKADTCIDPQEQILVPVPDGEVHCGPVAQVRR